jgi:multidrug efflux pump subunit AcrA (membrane-fusion protein)
MKRSTLVIALLALIIVIAGVFWMTRKPDEKTAGPATETTKAKDGAHAPKPALTVTVAKPEATELQLTLAANGNLAAWQEASVGAEANGLRWPKCW